MERNQTSLVSENYLRKTKKKETNMFLKDWNMAFKYANRYNQKKKAKVKMPQHLTWDMGGGKDLEIGTGGVFGKKFYNKINKLKKGN